TILLTSSLFKTFLVIAATVILPMLVIQVMIGRRNKEFDEQLPETLDLLASSMRAGFGLQQAIVSAGEEAKPPMGQELKRIANQTQMGMPLESSLRKMAERIGNKSFKWVVLAIAIHQETGGNLAEILDNLAESLRQRQTVYRQIKGLTAEGRLSASILFVLPLIESLLLFYANPGYMTTLVTTVPGILMLMVAMTLMVLGGLWLRKITNIEY
ncbi:MAG: type II secretion system F family protein, partial [Actinomycetia bacterium]|nr:type II secretion system F family protein [Actinomycetes bacterium]